MIRNINYYELGATLYIPVIHKDLNKIIFENKYPSLKSIVICLEDSISDNQVNDGLKNIEYILNNMEINKNLKIFIRPRNLQMLKDLLNYNNIYKIDGFSIPKFDTNNAVEYLDLFRKYNDFYFMPILETIDVFNQIKLEEISQLLKPFSDRVLTVRIGSEDILNLLKIRRNSNNMIYDILPFHMITAKIMQVFIPLGFNISGPVFNNFNNHEILHKEILKENEYGIFNKTIIHPIHIDEIQNKYKPYISEVEIAKRLLNGKEAIFSVDNAMYEYKTHKNWAENIILRMEEYGTI
jgi:citrate lyase beta subunit